ncbi:MAG: hypothetical protein CMJ81_11915 [Planctomycetaceae bacterium]|nr:hypothetical protein [Planctomycetaceae bacterium]MBP62698.1 hypothetical protein [Planctomycetaceae bacterium]
MPVQPLCGKRPFITATHPWIQDHIGRQVPQQPMGGGSRMDVIPEQILIRIGQHLVRDVIEGLTVGKNSSPRILDNLV